jgi:hypothetical protein
MVERCGFWGQSRAGFLTTFMKVVSNPRSGYNGQTGWIRLDVSMDGVFGSHYSEVIPSHLKSDGEVRHSGRYLYP